jgi:threonine aldolase
MKIIDLRSDTVTRPTPAMREAMMNAEVGDDVFAEDPTVNALQNEVAAMFGKEAALFCASGTQTNQIAIAVHTRPGDEVICSPLSHIYLYEGGGTMSNSGVSVRFLGDARGMFTANEVRVQINNPDDVHLPLTRLVSVEDTMNKGGGGVWDAKELARIAAVCKEKGLALHCDGARLFNALAVTGMAPAAYGALFDSISICLSKGLGAPVGSVLLGSSDFIRRARRIRKRFGGGMRQAGIIAEAGRYALKHHVSRLTEDHAHAHRMAEALAAQPWVSGVTTVQTNIVIFSVHNESSADRVKWLADRGIRCIPFGPDKIRMVFHLDITREDVEEAVRRMETGE